MTGESEFQTSFVSFESQHQLSMMTTMPSYYVGHNSSKSLLVHDCSTRLAKLCIEFILILTSRASFANWRETMCPNTHTEHLFIRLAGISRHYRTTVVIALVILFCGATANLPWAPSAFAAAESPGETTNTTNDVEEENSTNAPALPQAMIVLGLEESLKRDTAALETLRAEYDSPESEYNQAQTAFEEAQEEYRKLVEQAGEAATAETQSDLESAKQRAELAAQRFETAFDERQALRDKITVLEQTLAQSKASLARLRDGEEPASATNAPPTTTAGSTNASEDGSAPVQLPGPAGIATAAANEQGSTTQTNPYATTKSEDGFEETRELLEARQVLASKQAEAQEAEKDLQLIRERYVTRKTELEAVEKLIDSAKKKADVAVQERSALEQELEARRAEGASEEVVRELEQKIQATTAREEAARQQLEEQEAAAKELQGILARVDELEKVAVQTAEAKRQAVDKARSAVRFLQNPLHPQNLLRWLQRHGPKVLGIILLILVASLFIRLLSHRIIRLLFRSSSHGTIAERETRVQTLVSVFRSSASLAVIAGGAIMILDECGVPIGPLLGGAAIIGLAIAFGAQRLIGDFFHGFVILLENQYQVNDVIRVAGIAGLVERITLRVTVLRDLEGCVHFVPNGEIKAVTNMTHGWSRAVFDIGVAYKEDVDRVMEVLMELAGELRKDPKFSSLILEDPQMLGLDAMADSAVVVKFMIKTKPLQQWAVKREMLLRIKRRFDELGIEIPFPHRTVYLRQEGAEQPAPAGE